MIDLIRLSAEIAIPDDCFLHEKWRDRTIPAGTLIRYHRFRGVWVRYYPESQRMTITGKLIMLLENSEVLNVSASTTASISKRHTSRNTSIS